MIFFQKVLNNKRTEFFLVSIIVILIVLLLGYNSLYNFFVCDDFVLVNESLSLSIKDIPSLFTNTWRDYFNIYNWRQYSQGSDMYRPFTSVSFLLDSLLWGKNAFGYHFTNILIYIFSGMVVYYLSRSLIDSKWFSIGSTILFLFHPAHIDPLLNIINRSDSLVGLLFLSSILFYFYSKKKHSNYIYLSYLFCGLAIWAKETAIFLPLIILCYEWIFEKLNRDSLNKILPFFIIAGLYMLVRIYLFEGVGSYGGFNKIISLFRLSFIVNIVAFFGTLSLFGKEKYIPFVFTYKWIFLVFGCYLSYIFYKFLKFNEKRTKMFSWLFIGFILSLGPAIMIPSGRFLFSSIAFLSIGLMYCLYELRHKDLKMIVVPIICLILVLTPLWLKEWKVSIESSRQASEISKDFIFFLDNIEKKSENTNLFTILPDYINGESFIFLNGVREANKLFGRYDYEIYPLALIISQDKNIDGLDIQTEDAIVVLEDYKSTESIAFSQFYMGDLKIGDIIENDYSFIKILDISPSRELRKVEIVIKPEFLKRQENYLVFYKNGKFLKELIK